ncbi:UDP-glucose 4-epimerase GalE [Luteimonas sp. XNQY3]|nr:UDP-glucose 4-epimerase GalE [Luteimonas sp. XNQY3]
MSPVPSVDVPPASPLILVTGGTGYIGSHTCVCLHEADFRVLVVDDLSNSEAAVLDAIEAVSGQRPLFEQGDILAPGFLDAVVDRYRPAAAIHFAGVKSVAESARDPLRYYAINVAGSIGLANALARHGGPRIVFSSSATVYGEPDSLPLREDHPLRPESAYGRSKMMVEMMLADVCAGDARAGVVALRYFNPIGAHDSGRLGDSPLGEPENLVPYLGRVANGTLQRLRVFGGDYPTPDGTCVRDYVHVMDLAEAHVAALHSVQSASGHRVINIGTGVGTSVLDLVGAYAAASGCDLPYTIVARRSGDVACYYADPQAASDTLHWTSKRGLGEMCADAYRHVAHGGGKPWQRRPDAIGRTEPLSPG